MNRELTYDDIMKAGFNEKKSTITAKFKKTVNVKQYETEVVEMETTLELEQTVTGIERMLIVSFLEAQLEYSTIYSMYLKLQIPEQYYVQRQNELLKICNNMAAAFEAETGKSIFDYLR